jgi:hypothetical protein
MDMSQNSWAVKETISIKKQNSSELTVPKVLRRNVPQCRIQMYNTSKLQSFLPNIEMV